MDAEACACGISSGAEYGDNGLGAVYGMAKDDDDGMQRKEATLAKLTALVASVQNVLVAMLGDGA